MKQLPGKKVEELKKALAEAFPDLGKLEMLIREGLNENLNAIVNTKDSLEIVIFKLIEWSESQRQLAELVGEACEKRPKNTRLSDFYAWLNEWCVDEPNQENEQHVEEPEPPQELDFLRDFCKMKRFLTARPQLAFGRPDLKLKFQEMVQRLYEAICEREEDFNQVSAAGRAYSELRYTIERTAHFLENEVKVARIAHNTTLCARLDEIEMGLKKLWRDWDCQSLVRDQEEENEVMPYETDQIPSLEKINTEYGNLQQYILKEATPLLRPLLRNESQRRSMFIGAFIGNDDLLGGISYGGSANEFIRHMILYLLDRGKVDDGMPAIQRILEIARNSVGSDKRKRIDKLCRVLKRYMP